MVPFVLLMISIMTAADMSSVRSIKISLKEKRLNLINHNILVMHGPVHQRLNFKRLKTSGGEKGLDIFLIFQILVD